MRVTLVFLILMFGCQQVKTSPAATPREMSSPKMTTVGARVKTPAGVLIDAPDIAVGDGTMGISAATCGACHQRHYADWSRSTHAHALEDAQFLAEISKPSAPRWLCLNCHIPLQQQRAYIVDDKTALVDDAWDVGKITKKKNPKFNPALIKEAITCATCHVRADEDGRGVVIGPHGSKAAPHRVRKDPAHLEKICHRCHDPGPVEITPQFFCWFETRREIPADQRASCVDCHMPEVEAVPAIGKNARKMRAHWWRGGGPPKTKDRPRGDVGLEVKSVREKDQVKVILSHEGAGHWVPSGDPERHLVVAVNGEERVLGQHWDFGDRTRARPAKKLEDTRLRPGERRELVFKVDPSTPAVVRVTHVRVSETNGGYMAKTELHPEVRALLKSGGLDPDVAQQNLRAFKSLPLERELYSATHP